MEQIYIGLRISSEDFEKVKRAQEEKRVTMTNFLREALGLPPATLGRKKETNRGNESKK